LVERAVQCKNSNLNSAFLIGNDRTRACINNSVKVRVVAKANKLAVVVIDIIRAASVKYKALLVVATTSLA
jgi:hypothetical protein